MIILFIRKVEVIDSILGSKSTGSIDEVEFDAHTSASLATNELNLKLGLLTICLQTNAMFTVNTVVLIVLVFIAFLPAKRDEL